MSAHDLYGLVVGEIGRPHSEFLYDMKAWHLRAVIKGYFRRNRDLWSAVRWQTYNLMCVSMADLKKAGIYHPTDLIKFPWENESDTPRGNLPTEDEIIEMRNQIKAENERIAAAQQQNGNNDTE